MRQIYCIMKLILAVKKACKNKEYLCGLKWVYKYHTADAKQILKLYFIR